MLRQNTEVETGYSKKGLTGSEIALAVLGSKNARRSVGRTFSSPNKRKYFRNREVWMCYSCAGVETPAERVERERLEAIAAEEKRIADEQQKAAEARAKEEKRLAKLEQAKRWAEAKEQAKIAAAERKARQPEINRQLAAIRSQHRAENVTTLSISWRLIFQFPLLIFGIYIPLLELHLKRYTVAVVLALSYPLAFLTLICTLGQSQNTVAYILLLPLFMFLGICVAVPFMKKP